METVKSIDEMSNKELVSAILELPNNDKTKTALGKLNKTELTQEYLLLQDALESPQEDVGEELEPQVEEVKVEEEKAADEPQVDVKEDVAIKDSEPKTAQDLFLKDRVRQTVTVIDLDIYNKHFYFAKNKEGKVLVENLGFGDVYFGEGEVTHGDKTQRLVKGQEVELDADKPIGLVSSSSPRVRITEI